MRLVPHSQPALEALQWFGLLGPPLAFAGEHVLGFGATVVQCNPAGSHWSIEPHLYQLATTGVAGGVVVAGGVAALLAYLGTKHLHYEDDPPRGRIRFLSTAAVVAAPLFLALVLLSGIGSAAHPACHQA